MREWIIAEETDEELSQSADKHVPSTTWDAVHLGALLNGNPAMDRVRFEVGGGNAAKSTDLRWGIDFRFPSSSASLGLIYVVVVIPRESQDP